MRIVSNEKLIRRNARISQFASVGGLAILAGGMYVSFRYPEQVGLAWLALLIGFILSQAGLYYGNRWGRRPRPDEHLNEALKDLDNRYSIYHFFKPTHHLLVGPAGIWVLLPRHQAGTIVYEKNRWKQKGGGFVQGYLRLFAQEGIGRPDLEVTVEVDNVSQFLQKHLPETQFPAPQAALVFTNPNTTIDESTNEAPAPTLQAQKLKELIRKSAKTSGLTPEQTQKIQEILE